MGNQIIDKCNKCGSLVSYFDGQENITCRCCGEKIQPLGPVQIINGNNSNEKKMYYGRDRKTIYELDSLLSQGGEGLIYTIKKKPEVLAKIYKPQWGMDFERRNMARDKILAMLDMHFNPKYDGGVYVTWPEDALFDSAGLFVGFIMPKLRDMKSITWGMRPADRKSLWPNGYRWSYSVAIAYNLAQTIEVLHRAGIVVGDMNPNNILIDAKGNITLIDADSFEITSTGEIYKCCVGFAEMLPPELQGRDLTIPTVRFSKETDCFSLAILIFQILCNNCHPFACMDNTRRGHSSSSKPGIMDNIMRGYCPYVTNSKGKIADDAPDMDVFPKEIRKLFDRAFDYNENTAVSRAVISQRPSAKEWCIALQNLIHAGFQVCHINPHHMYPVTYKKGCPWCAIDEPKSLPMKPFINFTVDNISKTRVSGGEISDAPKKHKTKTTLFLSYCSKDQPIANIIQEKIKEKLGDSIAISVYTDLSYRSSFKEFMNTIQDHDYVLCLVSDHYLKSMACMYEAGEIVKDRHYQDKLLFVVISESEKEFYRDKIEDYSPVHIYGTVENSFSYIEYWKKKHCDLRKKIEEIDDPEACEPLLKEMKKIGKIYRYDIEEFISYLIDHKGKSLKEHLDDDFDEMINQISE